MFRKSNKQRRAEIKGARRARAKQLADTRNVYSNKVPPDAVAADWAELEHNNTYSQLPRFYLDKAFDCRDCGAQELWTAKQQKWWYEVAKGHIDSLAVRCRPCRKKEQARKAAARKTHLEGLARKQEQVQ